MKTLLRSIFNHDFADCGETDIFHARFFGRALTLPDLRMVCYAVCESSATIPAAIRIPGKRQDAPFAVLAQLHGNEPAGLAGILLAMALADAGKLERDVIGVIGNPLAARQYFEAYMNDPRARQETRDAFRCGLSEIGALLPDMNRIPVDFLTRPPTDAHTKRAQELYALGRHIGGIVDIHSARGNMVCITDHKRDADLKDSPIRSVLTELAEAISAGSTSAVTVQTLKTVLHPLPNITSQTGIEAGRHEAPESPRTAASFTLSLLHTLGITTIAPYYQKEDGNFVRYGVRPRLTYGDLIHEDSLQPDDRIYMAKACRALASVPPGCDTVIVRRGDGYALQSAAEFTRKPAGSMEFAVYQYDEMEAINKDQVVAVALPSGTLFRAPADFAGIFFSKSGALYDKDPSVGPWPVAADKIAGVKFCYPCDVGSLKLSF